MYKISVPIMNCNVKRSNRERLLEEIKRFGAERIFLALDTYETDPEKRAFVMEELSDNCKFFKAEGFEVGAWIWTFWVKGETDFTLMRTLSGALRNEFMCPLDKNFTSFAATYISDIAKCGVDLIQFDDDFRYGIVGDLPACLCEHHIKLINEIIGENLTREEIKNHILSGSKNKVRDAYLKANGTAFRYFASEVRKAVDKVNPEMRISLCSCMSSWDIDGTDAFKLSRILSGDNKPIARLIGAPYWAVNKNWGNNLNDVIELERMESVWTKKGDIEIMAEGDAYPRPRINCPASYLECFDTAIRASGCTDGILKYGIDYTSNASYETGYAKFHEKNRPVYSAIDKMFANKKSAGVRVYESMNKVADMVMPTKVNNEVNIEDLFFSKAARSLTACSIPTVYEGDGVCGIVFDENARNLPLSALEKGLIIDIAAAEILTERGIDVGLNEIGEILPDAYEEHYINDDNYIATYSSVIYNIKISEKAEILSDTATSKGDIPVSYRYENGEGQRFLVLNVNTRNSIILLKHQARSLQYAESILWLSENKLPAYIYGNPNLYLQCKKDENSMAVGLWNIFADKVLDPVTILDKAYKSIEFANCSGRIEGNKVYLSDIEAFGFAFFEVKD